MAIYVKRFVSLFLILILLIICNITVFATGSMNDEQRAEDIDTEIHILTDINELPNDTIIIAEETAPITISATAQQFRAAGLEPPQGSESKAAIVQINVQTLIGYTAADGLNFYIRAYGPWYVLLKSMSGSVAYKVSGWTRSTVPVGVSVWRPQSAINWFYGTGRHPASGKSVSATFFVDVNALNEIAGGSISRQVTGVIP